MSRLMLGALWPCLLLLQLYSVLDNSRPVEWCRDSDFTFVYRLPIEPILHFEKVRQSATHQTALSWTLLGLAEQGTRTLI